MHDHDYTFTNMDTKIGSPTFYTIGLIFTKTIILITVLLSTASNAVNSKKAIIPKLRSI